MLGVVQKCSICGRDIVQSTVTLPQYVYCDDHQVEIKFTSHADFAFQQQELKHDMISKYINFTK